MTEPSQPPATWAPNGCSDPIGLYREQAYRPCCDVHDLAYYIGGAEVDRRRADLILHRCIALRGYPQDADTMLVALRLFGWRQFRYRSGKD